MTRYAKLGGKAKHVKNDDDFNVTPLIPTRKSSKHETPVKVQKPIDESSNDHNSSSNSGDSSNKNSSSNNNKRDQTNKGNKGKHTDKVNKKRKSENSDHVSSRKEQRIRAKDRNTICFGCRQKGHSVENCKESKQGIQGICYNCGTTEHTLKQCKKPRKGNTLPYAKCFICEEKGHLAGQCPQNTKGLYPDGGGCRFCGQVDHLAKDCKVTKEEAGTTVVGKIDLDQGADDDDYHIFVTEQRKHTDEVAVEKKVAPIVARKALAPKKKVVKF